jgi:hypothetical protein
MGGRVRGRGILSLTESDNVKIDPVRRADFI